MSHLFDKYLDKLGIQRRKPSLPALKEIIKAHLIKIPFENISKLFYYKNYNMRTIPDFKLYIDGIVKNNFGGTCYSSNFYLNKLLDHLGYNVRLCGADMMNPDVHIANVITINNKEYLVDVGYAAPFLTPLPLYLSRNYEITLGNNRYILLPKYKKGRSEIQLYRDDKLSHSYTLKPQVRSISEFEKVIEDSFRASATFMNAILLVRFGVNSSVVIHNFSILKTNKTVIKKTDLKNKSELAAQITANFKIPVDIVEEALETITNFKDAWN